MERIPQTSITDLLKDETSLDVLDDPHLTNAVPLSQYNGDVSTFEETHTAEVQTDQEMPCVRSNSISQKHSKRTNNFSAEEDELVIAAWLNTSLHPVKVSGQKNNQFWKRFTRYFEDNKRWPDVRTEKSLINRWSKISFGVHKFSGYYAAVEHLRKSGYTDAEKIQEAKTIYKDKEGHHFGLDHCWTLLRFQHKWLAKHKKFEASTHYKAPSPKNLRSSIILEDDDDDPDPEPAPAPLKRPIEIKAAKAANKKGKFNWRGGNDVNKSSKTRSVLEEFRARRLNSDSVKAEQLNMLIDIEQKQVALREKEVELQAQSEETKIMCIDTSSMNPVQAEYFNHLQREILAKRAGKNGNE